ncbi:Serine phosphatase RsbU, regulator of sigma subunit [Actinokineospora spheciospongiae]|uniref:Serine phosphatase RsbU, regulator of sigma subunit n=1 Tax=Actinokineospora spheciospongiae TaxID=909613 RepID=W7JE44_9PSEU|nr:ATP-binding protein [Actinokineospora spheciospongiae]EWC64254.1 Serine phosphatase RsbU, regulator of sigma subunit [Actinokineospora spheciospongiae]
MIDAHTPDAEHPGTGGVAGADPAAGDPRVLVVTVPADSTRLPALRRRLGRWLDGRGVTGPLRDDVVLAADEAVANSVEHGYRERLGGLVGVTVTVLEESVTLVVVDHGAWKPPAPDREDARGWGLRMVAALAERLDVVHANGRTTVTAHFRRDAGCRG